MGADSRAGLGRVVVNMVDGSRFQVDRAGARTVRATHTNKKQQQQQQLW